MLISLALVDGDSQDVAVAGDPSSWLSSRIHDFGVDVGSVIPEGFDAYVRLFHPIELAGRDTETWSDVARRNERIVHPEMQFHLISRPRGSPAPAGYERGVGPEWGSLPLDERRVLVDILRSATTTPTRCWFAIWEGYGGMDDRSGTERLDLPHRVYLLRDGPIDRALESYLEIGDQSPNLWWPEDHAWVVATDIDLAWTYVGGSTRTIQAVLAHPPLEALPAAVTDKPFYDSDLLNSALDG